MVSKSYVYVKGAGVVKVVKKVEIKNGNDLVVSLTQHESSQT